MVANESQAENVLYGNDGSVSGNYLIWKKEILPN